MLHYMLDYQTVHISLVLSDQSDLNLWKIKISFFSQSVNKKLKTASRIYQGILLNSL